MRWRMLTSAVVFLATVSNARAVSLTYDLIDYAANQNGWTLSGSITTDGIFGSPAPSDIVSWNWIVTNGNTSVSYNSDMTPNTCGVGFPGQGMGFLQTSPDCLITYTQSGRTVIPSSTSTTLILVCRPRSSGIMPLWVDSRCGIRTNAIPVSEGS